MVDLKSKRSKELQKFSAKQNLGEDGDMERKRKREREEKMQKKFHLIFSLIGLYKEEK